VGLAALAAAFVLAVSIIAILVRRKRPYVAVGWFWYLAMLTPTLGLVQAGSQAHADRYTYLPQIGLLLVAAWGAAEWAARSIERTAARRRLVAVAGAGAVVLLGLIAFRQTGYWSDSVTLWRHCLDCDPDNHLAHNNLGAVLARGRRFDDAIGEFKEAIRLFPQYESAYANLGASLLDLGRRNEAATALRQALALDPRDAKAAFNYGECLLDAGNIDEALKF
jgi:protein O-mannosyl-transferase